MPVRNCGHRIKELGLELVCIAGYNDFTAGVDRSGVPNVEIQAIYIGELARLARDLGTNMVRVFTGYERPDLPYASQYAMVVGRIENGRQNCCPVWCYTCCTKPS